MISSLLAGLLVYRIFHLRLLSRPFKALALMLAVAVLRDFVLFTAPYTSHRYTMLWELTLPALLAAQIWAGYDTLRAVAALYPKLGTFAVRVFLACLAITIVGCCLGLPFELRRIAGHETLLRSLFVLQRWVDSWIAGTLVLVAFFFARFPAPVKQPPRNLVIHTVLLAAYFAGYSILFFAENLRPLGSAEMAERLQAYLISALYLVWAITLSSKGQNSGSWPQVDVVSVKRIAPHEVNRAASGS